MTVQRRLMIAVLMITVGAHFVYEGLRSSREDG